MAEAPISVRLRHKMPGRLRLRLVRPVADLAWLEGVAGVIGGLSGVESVEARAGTGSIIIRHDASFAGVEALCAATGLQLEGDEPEAERFDPMGFATRSLAKLESDTVRYSGGQADLTNIVFMMLVAAGVVQAVRGQVVGPALTLFGQAATLLAARPLRNLMR